MRACLFLLFVVGQLVCVLSAAGEEYANRPRGVPPEKASFYQRRKEFECLDGSKKIPFDRVNDDYCDCNDGSDEPGTSACSNGSFYCRNAGFRPLTVPSSRVNDFICDCCDGSDEWDSGVTCLNMCEAQGSKAREEAKASRLIQEAGYKKRLELAKEGLKSLEERKVEVQKQKKELEELEPLKTSAEAKKNEVEQRERESKEKHDSAWNERKEGFLLQRSKDLFEKIDKDGDSKVSIDELRKHTGTEEDGGGGLKVSKHLERIFKESTELVIDEFHKKYQKVKNFMDRARKSKMTEEEREKEEEEEEEKEDDKDDDDEDDIGVPKPPYDDATQKLIEEANAARQEFEEVSKKVSELETSIRSAESFLEFEYGADHSWAPLRHQCAELTVNQYTYRLCLFDRSIQKDRNGHSEVNLGYWNTWVGPDSDKFSMQMYDKGQSCWNGPERSTKVEVECGEELQLLEASEPSKCEYKFRLKAPPACSNPAEADTHTEL